MILESSRNNKGSLNELLFCSKSDLLDLICSEKNKSGYYTKETTWKMLFPMFYDELLSWEIPDEFIFKQKVYHFLNNDPDLLLGRCSECGKRCRFIGIKNGYNQTCSVKCCANSCSRREKFKQTCLEKYGVEHPLQNKEIQDKVKQTCLEKYGVENPFQLEEYRSKYNNHEWVKSIEEKKKQTCLEHYGTEYYTQTDEYKERSKQTCLDRYGVEYYSQTDEYREKYKETCLDRYGVDHYLQSDDHREKYKETCLDRYGKASFSQTDEYRDKVKQTCLEKYGVDHVFQTDSFKEKKKQVCLEKYGVEYYSQAEEIKEKKKQTCLDKYGVENYSQTDEYDEKKRQTCLEKYGVENYSQTKEFQEKRKETCLEKYGVENYSQTDEYREKSYQTKKKNNTFSSSKIEDQLKEYFDLNNINYIYQYRSDLYPFSCDFYFPDMDLYVEIQGSWTHGDHPFTGSEEDLKTVELWRSKGSKYYDNAISVWTIRDVKKRETAEKNGLNWIEIFSCDLDECLKEIGEHCVSHGYIK